MKRTLLLSFVFSLIFLLAIPFQAYSQQIVPGQLLVQLHPGKNPSQFIQEMNQSLNGRMMDHSREISKDLRLHLLTYDTLAMTPELALELLFRRPEVSRAQYNHYVNLRGSQAIPNDPNYALQWALENTGQNGGTPGADVSAVEAWDRTTGGLTVLGDTIVVAVIDDGFELTHEDLTYWQNRNEIPGNGIDDDQNGYVDDVRGWNAYNSTANLPLALHGTHVAGVLGAKGDNGLGGSGINWNLQIMPIAGSSGTEDVVLEAYGYALAQRKLYDQTLGEKGAYVVVTNSSFGVDNADPAQFPLWCAMYDTLGAYGIISVAAAMNIGSNVEASGDVPTRCTSPYLIAVTNTTPADLRNPSAAFGTTSVDLGAPGSGIYSTLPNNGYGFQTGTSFAAPLVSGTLALMFADACPAFMLNYEANPAQVALTFKQLLLEGVDTLQALSAEVVTSGRLNADKALQKLADTCALLPADCLPPYAPDVSQIRDTAVSLTWTAIDSTLGFQLRYRLTGNSNWEDSSTSILPPFELTGLAACVAYDWQVGTICADGSVAYFGIRSFQTEGCCEPPAEIRLISLTDSTLTLGWDNVFGSTDYSLRFRPEGSNNWINVLLGDTNQVTIATLNPCSVYEVQVKVQCDTLDLGFSATSLFQTAGCGACLDLEYCSTQGLDVNFEWIAGVELGPLSRQSGADNGYIELTEPVFVLPVDSLIPVTLTPGYNGPAFDETWAIWIDLNRDGIFTDSTELLYESGPERGQVDGVMFIPDSVEPGNTRMRVSMRFAGFTGTNRPVSCGTFGEGETEDYCVWIQPKDTSVCPAPSFVLTDFLPGSDTLRVRWLAEAGSDSFLIKLEGLEGQPGLSFISDTTELLVGNLTPCSRYSLSIQPFCGGLLGFGTEAEMIRSKGCGPCQDLGYCPSGGKSDSLWIERFELGDLALSTGPNGGYGDFTDFSQSMKQDTGYVLTLIAGYTGEEREVFWDIWIDWQGDGIFWVFDRVGQATAMSGDTLSGIVSLPNGFVPGGTRLRVTVRDGQEAGACELFGSGEVEDYCIDLVNPVSIATQDISLRVYPNPTPARLNISASSPIQAIRLGDVMGRILQQQHVSNLSLTQVDVSSYPSGLYWIEVETLDGKVREWVRVE